MHFLAPSSRGTVGIGTEEHKGPWRRRETTRRPSWVANCSATRYAFLNNRPSGLVVVLVFATNTGVRNGTSPIGSTNFR